MMSFFPPRIFINSSCIIPPLCVPKNPIKVTSIMWIIKEFLLCCSPIVTMIRQKVPIQMPIKNVWHFGLIISFYLARRNTVKKKDHIFLLRFIIDRGYTCYTW